MARPRSSGRGHLPPYVALRSGRFYLEPKGALREKLNDKSSIPLGATYVEMFRRYGELTQEKPLLSVDIHTMAQLIDRYMTEVAPEKAPSTYKSSMPRFRQIRNSFGQMDPRVVTKVDIITYFEWRSQSGKTNANRELALISAIFRKAEDWGVVTTSPCVRMRYNKEKPRERYISDEEYIAFSEFARKENPLIAAYMDFKYVTALRRTDILRLTKHHIVEDGIILNISKNDTLRLMEWSPNLRKATQNLINASRLQVCRRYSGSLSDYLLHSRQGLPYKDSGLRSIFSRIMQKALQQKILAESFCDHDIRAKAGSDSTTVEEARRLLVHHSDRVTQKHYRRKIERIKPLM